MKNLLRTIAIFALLLSAVNVFAGKNDKESVTFNVAMKCHKCQAKIEENKRIPPMWHFPKSDD